MNLKYILAAGVVALLAGCDESRFLDTKPQGTLNDDLLSWLKVWNFWSLRLTPG